MTKPEEHRSKWTTPADMKDCRVYCQSSCVAFSTVFNGDDGTKLIIAQSGYCDMDKRLRVFEGLVQHSECALVDKPVSIVSIFPEPNSVPMVIVASGPALLAFKALKPYYKHTVPGKEANETETTIWKDVENTKEGREKLYQLLEKRSNEVSFANLTYVSQTYLMSNDKEQAKMIKGYGTDLKDFPLITCIGKIPKSLNEVKDIVVIGTEHRKIMLSECFTTSDEFLLPSIPVSVLTHGTYDDYQLFVLTRDSIIYSIKRGDTEPKPIIVSQSMITSVALVGKMIVYSTSEYMIHFCNFEGEILNTVKCQSKIKMLEPFFHSHKQLRAVIAVFEKEIRMYDEHHMLDIVKYEKALGWVKYGTYGKEEGTLVVCYEDGLLAVQTFRRTANFEHKMEYDSVQCC
uniref:BBS1 domain-containing protein n=1 Tax=Caenorhabditis tropicalis TaxID=1561998 RepID=A0A1I7TL82_9PELO